MWSWHYRAYSCYQKAHCTKVVLVVGWHDCNEKTHANLELLAEPIHQSSAARQQCMLATPIMSPALHNANINYREYRLWSQMCCMLMGLGILEDVSHVLWHPYHSSRMLYARLARSEHSCYPPEVCVAWSPVGPLDNKLPSAAAPCCFHRERIFRRKAPLQ